MSRVQVIPDKSLSGGELVHHAQFEAPSTRIFRGTRSNPPTAASARQRAHDVRTRPLEPARANVQQTESRCWAEDIRDAYCRGIGALIECGRLICSAKAELPHGDFQRMVERELPFGARTAQKLMTIASDHRLTNTTHASHLPASWSTLYELTKLDDAVFARSIANRLIHPEMKRRDAITLQGTPILATNQLELFGDTEFLLAKACRKLEKALRRHEFSPAKLSKNSVMIIESVITAIRTMQTLVRSASKTDALEVIATEIDRLEHRVNSLMGPSKVAASAQTNGDYSNK